MTDEFAELFNLNPESKIAATHRLRQEGRWEEASLYRDEQRLRLRDEGMTRHEAREESWRLMLEKYPRPDVFGPTYYHFMADFPPRSLPQSL